MGCGSLLLEEGYYHVNVNYTRDDWPNSLEGKTTQADWHITESDGKYRLRVMGSSTDVDGFEDNYQIRFIKETEQDCGGTHSFDVILNPNRNNTEFKGTGSVWVSFCSGGGLLTQAEFLGWKIPKPKKITHQVEHQHALSQDSSDSGFEFNSYSDRFGCLAGDGQYCRQHLE